MLHSGYPPSRKRAHISHLPRSESPEKARPALFDRVLRRSGASDISRRTFLTWMGATAALLTSGIPLVRASAAHAVKVGCVLPEKGPLAGEARSLVAGFELFMKERGREEPPVEIVRKDPGPSEENSLEALASLLVDKEVRFLIGPLSLEASEKAIHAVAGAEVIFFVSNPSVRLVAGEMCLSQSFRLCGNTYQCAQPLAPWAIKNIGLKAFLTGTDDWMENEQADFFALGIERGGGMFADRVMVPEGSGGFKEVFEEVRRTQPHFLFASFRDKHAQAFLKAFRNASPRLSQPIIGPCSLVEFPQQPSGEARNAVGLRTLTTIKNPKTIIDLIREKLDRRISHVSRAAEGYDIAQIICRAAKNSGEPSNDLSPTIKAIEEMKVEGFRGKVHFDKNHEAVLNMMVQEWELKDRALHPKIVDDLGPVASPDFGCGRVGFPKRPDMEPREPEQPDDDLE